MNIYYPEIHKFHNPPYEGFDSAGIITALELPERLENILTAIKAETWANILTPNTFDLEVIMAVHSQLYLEYLQSAYDDWIAHSPVPGMAFIPGTYNIPFASVTAGKVAEEAGFFLLDTTVAITAGTYQAALQSTYAGLSAAQKVALSGQSAFALCRPPGHHAGREICGGYCFLNNAAIAVQWLTRFGRVVILDIDYHAGNGTQQIFYNRPDVLVISIHADPRREYPHYAAGEMERGVGPGFGYHKNYPLPANIQDQSYLQVLDQPLRQITNFYPKSLVVSFGTDIYREDPLGDFKIICQGIQAIGKRIAALGLPSLVVMEGGYHLPTIGKNVVVFLESFTTLKNTTQNSNALLNLVCFV